MVQPVALINGDPRQKFRAAFHMGLPGYFGTILDYEHQLMRELSVHGDCILVFMVANLSIF